MEGNTRLSYQFAITEQAYIYCSTPKKELLQIITQKCFTNLFFLKTPKQGTKLSPYLCLDHDNVF